MEAETPEATAQDVFAKAHGVGLANITVEYSKKVVINWKSIGRRTEYGCRVQYRGSMEQQTAFKALLSEEQKEDMDCVRLGPGKGEDCPEFTVYATADGAERTLQWNREDKKVYVLEFWASWCMPCKNPLNALHGLQVRNPDWTDWVEVLALSVDDTCEEAQTRISEMNWTNFGSFWCGEGTFSAAAPSLLCVDKIPTRVIVRRGKILWRGHPNQRDLEADIRHLAGNEELPEGEIQCNETGPAFTGESLVHKLAYVESILGAFTGPVARITSPFFSYELITFVTSEGTSHKGVAITGGSYKKGTETIVEEVVEKMKLAFPVIAEKFRFA